MTNPGNKSFLKRIWFMLLAVGPGFFAIGYTIGTGSVTSMAKAGSEFGTQLLWVLALSVFFSWVMMEAYGRYAVVTGGTAMHGIRGKVKFGRALAIAIIVGCVLAQWTCLSGIIGLTSNAIYELIHIFFPGTSPTSYWAVLGIALVMTIILYGILLLGEYSIFEKILVICVTVMGLSFIVSMFIVLPEPGEIVRGFVPSIPDVEGGKLLVAAFVGTTMAAPVFVTRPLFIQGKGWGKENTREQSRDAIVSAILMFVVSGSIIIAATGAVYHEGKTIDKVLDMVYTLEPVAGKFAVAIFIVGTLSAGISSIFPILMVAPILIADYRKGRLDTKSSQFKVITAIAALIGLTVPILGSNPIVAQITTKVSGVFVLPLAVAGIALLVNRKEMGKHRAGIGLNAGMLAAFLFSCFMVYTGYTALIDLFGN